MYVMIFTYEHHINSSLRFFNLFSFTFCHFRSRRHDIYHSIYVISWTFPRSVRWSYVRWSFSFPVIYVLDFSFLSPSLFYCVLWIFPILFIIHGIFHDKEFSDWYRPIYTAVILVWGACASAERYENKRWGLRI